MGIKGELAKVGRGLRKVRDMIGVQQQRASVYLEAEDAARHAQFVAAGLDRARSIMEDTELTHALRLLSVELDGSHATAHWVAGQLASIPAEKVDQARRMLAGEAVAAP